MKIYNRYTKDIIFKCKKETVKEVIIEAIKSKADLFGADLSEADLSGANLSGANLSKADLSWANLSGARLCDTEFNKTKIIFRNKIVEVNFTEVK
ncbi:MAG: pentapeptide repeat-containing protein [Nanoarchaeota archaeon]